MNLLVADDRPDRLERWLERLASVPEIEESFGTPIALTGGDLKSEVDELSARRAATRFSKARGENVSWFDQAALVIVDYDLTDLEGHSTETGIGVAYLARCFSDCGLITALNQFGENPFDLSGLGDYAGFADVDVGGDQLDNAGLWISTREWPDFRPWAWPVLPAEIERLRRLTDQVEEVGLDRSVFEVLGLKGRLATAFAPEVSAPLGERPERATFRTLLREPSMGLRRDDAIVGDRRSARAAAARASQWLERWILSAQDRLVDAPHLALRYPSLVTERDLVMRCVDHNAATGLRDDILDDHRFTSSDWLSRPAWWGAAVSADERIDEVADPWNAPDVDEVFLEDRSRFAPRESGRAYRIEVPADSRVRYVGNAEDVTYRPVSSFART